MIYKEYIKSYKWKKRKKEYIKKFWDKCWVCENEWKQLHHRTYKNLWNEKDEDLILLCRRCHHKLHFWFDWYLYEEIFFIDEEKLKHREEFTKVLYSKEEKYIELNNKRKQKLKEIWEKNIEFQRNIWNNFIQKFWIKTYIDFCEIYKEINNFKEIFNYYWIDYDKEMYYSFKGVIANTKRFWITMDNILKFWYKKITRWEYDNINNEKQIIF